jgi:hypothetical protein
MTTLHFIVVLSVFAMPGSRPRLSRPGLGASFKTSRFGLKFVARRPRRFRARRADGFHAAGLSAIFAAYELTG